MVRGGGGGGISQWAWVWGTSAVIRMASSWRELGMLTGCHDPADLSLHPMHVNERGRASAPGSRSAVVRREVRAPIITYILKRLLPDRQPAVTSSPRRLMGSCLLAAALALLVILAGSVSVSVCLSYFLSFSFFISCCLFLSPSPAPSFNSPFGELICMNFCYLCTHIVCYSIKLIISLTLTLLFSLYFTLFTLF